MTLLFIAMLVILALAGTVVLYVAYPHRGEQVPQVSWVGDALRRGVEALPTIDNQLDSQLDSRPSSRGEREGVATGSR